MRALRLFAGLIIAVILIHLCAGELRAQRPLVADREEEQKPKRGRGYIPIPADWSRFELPDEVLRALQPPPTSWDWRALGGVTPIKDQLDYETCWAFAAVAELESRLVIHEGLSPDYSEHNVVACAANPFYDLHGYSCYTGGNERYAVSYWAQLGSVNEGCDPYPGSCPAISCSNPACTYHKQVTEWKIFGSNVTTIKNALMDTGPLYATMCASCIWDEFVDYDGTYCIDYPGGSGADHAVLIVGWNDYYCGGQGGWIVKNSYGVDWGDDGYFYIGYGHADIGNTSAITGYKDYDPTEKVYLLDEYGWWYELGWTGDCDIWGMVEITPIWSGNLHAVDLWIPMSLMIYEIHLFDDFISGSLTNPLLPGAVEDTLMHAGYYSIDLPSPVPVTTGDPVYIAVRFRHLAAGCWAGVALDKHGPMGTNKSFMSPDGIEWIAQDHGGTEYGDVGIRGRVLPNCYPNLPPPDLEIMGWERIEVGGNLVTYYWMRITNWSQFPDVLFEAAPDLPPCGANPNASRTWVDVYDQLDEKLNGFCGLSSSSDLNGIWFSVHWCDPPPTHVYIKLWDRRCDRILTSNLVPVPVPTCEQPVVSVGGYTEISWVDPLWEIQVEVHNAGPGTAFNVHGTMDEDLGWLTIPDPVCSYGDIPEGSSSYGGADSYTLDLTNYPGGSFRIKLMLSPVDSCCTTYMVGENLELDPEATGLEMAKVTTFDLVQNYPNPFNPYTRINYQIPVDCNVSLRIYDVSGRLVRTLVDDHKNRGRHTIIWDGRDATGRQLASGIYFYRIQAGTFVETKRMVLLR